MTFLEAALEVLRLEGKPLHYKELTERVIGKKLLTFVGRTPEVTMQTQLTGAVKKAPGNPFVRVKPGIFDFDHSMGKVMGELPSTLKS